MVNKLLYVLVQTVLWVVAGFLIFLLATLTAVTCLFFILTILKLTAPIFQPWLDWIHP